MDTAALRPISGLYVLPVLLATCCLTSVMSVFNTWPPKTTSPSRSPSLVRAGSRTEGRWFMMHEQMPSPRLSSSRSQREASASSCPTVCEEPSHRLVQGDSVHCAMLSVSPSAYLTSDSSSSFQVRFHDTESTLANVTGLFTHTCFSFFFFFAPLPACTADTAVL